MADDVAAADLVLSYVESIPDHVMRPFAETLSSPPFVVRLDRRKSPGPWAGVEWLLPTAALLYVAKSYFDAFLEEAGKEHYHLLKKGLAGLWGVFFGGQRSFRVQVITAGSGKAEQAPKYSRSFSLFAEGPDGSRVKLLLRDAAPPEELNATVERFFAVLAKYHRGGGSQPASELFGSSPPLGRVFLLAYDPAADQLRLVDPRETSRGGDDGA